MRDNLPAASKKSGPITALALAGVYGVETGAQGRASVRAALKKLVPNLQLESPSQTIWNRLAIKACAATGVLPNAPTTQPATRRILPRLAGSLNVEILRWHLNGYTRYCLARAAWSLGAFGQNEFWAPMNEQLMKRQARDGGWPPESAGGRIYSTDMAILTLTIPYDLMPGME